jgi:folate-dependent phosphoribosylglycinamide formyltransferase PurN
VRIVLYTHEAWEEDARVRYLHDRVCGEFEDVKVVATRQSERRGWNARLRRLRWKWDHLGWRYTIELLSGLPLQRLLLRQDSRRVQRALDALPRSVSRAQRAETICVESANGSDAVAAIASLRPDVIVQAGAGLLQPWIFELASVATVNVHNGIAPLIKGNFPVYWSRLERRPEWLGATVHIIDRGIDTGRPIAYYRPGRDGDEVALEVDVTRGGCDALIDALHRFERGDEWEVPIPPGEPTYRSTVSGWRLLALRLSRS